MAIAHLATEYVFSDFLLKEPSEPKFKGLRLELAVDKMVTYIAVGLPLLLISLAFAQEISTEFWSRGVPEWLSGGREEEYSMKSVHPLHCRPG